MSRNTALLLIWAILIILNFTPRYAIAGETTAPIKGGAMLEFPRGRFQENAPPDFFKWISIKKVKSWTLKVYHTNPSGAYDPEKDLMARFDFLSQIESMSWTQETFTRGNYLWILEGYDESNSKPVTVDTANFEIEALKNFDIKTFRMGIIAGFSRGKYTSIDPTIKLEFNTTPTIYGLVLYGGKEDLNWDVSAYVHDFVLRGGVQETMTLKGGYYFRVSPKNPYGTELYAGPYARLLQFPQVRSPDFVNITTDNVMVFNPGAAVTVQRQFDMRVSLYTQVGLDLPVYGTEDTTIGADQMNYYVHSGLLYGLFWPVGFSGEIQYHHDAVETKNGADTVNMEQNQFSVMANLLYAF